MKKIFFLACTLILTACDDPYELSQQEFEKIYTDDNNHKVVYFNQEMTIAFICDDKNVEKKANGDTSCKGSRRYIHVAKLTNKFQTIVFKDLKKELATSRSKIDIRKLIDKVSKITNKSFVINPEVHGKVPTIKSTGPNNVFNEFSSILKAYDYILTDRKGFILIEPKHR